MTYKLFRISLILVLCFGVFITGVAEVCWCQPNCPCCKSQGLQYETEKSVRSACNRGCWAAGRIPCDVEKVPDMAHSSTGDSLENVPDRAVDFAVIHADYVFDKLLFAHFARTPSGKARSKPPANYLQNQSLLL